MHTPLIMAREARLFEVSNALRRLTPRQLEDPLERDIAYVLAGQDAVTPAEDLDARRRQRLRHRHMTPACPRLVTVRQDFAQNTGAPRRFPVARRDVDLPPLLLVHDGGRGHRG